MRQGRGGGRLSACPNGRGSCRKGEPETGKDAWRAQAAGGRSTIRGRESDCPNGVRQLQKGGTGDREGCVTGTSGRRPQHKQAGLGWHAVPTLPETARS